MTLLCCNTCADYLKFGRLPECRDLIHEIRSNWKNTDYQFSLIQSATTESLEPCELCGDRDAGQRSEFEVHDQHLRRV